LFSKLRISLGLKPLEPKVEDEDAEAERNYREKREADRREAEEKAIRERIEK
jgi:hypothetical protein